MPSKKGGDYGLWFRVEGVVPSLVFLGNSERDGPCRKVSLKNQNLNRSFHFFISMVLVPSILFPLIPIYISLNPKLEIM